MLSIKWYNLFISIVRLHVYEEWKANWKLVFLFIFLWHLTSSNNINKLFYFLHYCTMRKPLKNVQILNFVFKEHLTKSNNSMIWKIHLIKAHNHYHANFIKQKLKSITTRRTICRPTNPPKIFNMNGDTTFFLLLNLCTILWQLVCVFFTDSSFDH